MSPGRHRNLNVILILAVIVVKNFVEVSLAADS